jgi:hypothetical protein
MGCLMKNGIATYGSLSHEYYVLKTMGELVRYIDAMRMQ